MIGGDTMLKALKSYWAFTNLKYKLIMLVLFPLLLVVISMNVYRLKVELGFASFIMLYWIDMISDDHFMGGFYQRGNKDLGFMQSTPRFRKTMREIAVVDAIRRVVLYQIPYITLLWCSMGDVEAMEACRLMAFMPWLEALIAQMTVLIKREYTTAEEGNLSVSGGYICFLVIVFLIEWIGDMAGGNFIPVNVVLIVLILVAIIGTGWYTDKKMRESYYD